MTESQPVETQVVSDAPVVQETNALARQPVEPGSILSIIQTAVVNKADVAVMRELLAIRREERADQAREAFANALVLFRKLVKPVIMTGLRDDTKTANSRGEYGTVKYPYAELTTTIEQIQPMLDQCQLTPTWRMVKNDPGWVEIECVVTHVLGYKESSMPFGSPVGEGRRGQTPVQVRTGVITSLKRVTLFMVLGLTTREDDKHLQNAEQGDEPKQPKSAALMDPAEQQVRKDFWNLCQKKAGVKFTAEQVRRIFTSTQQASGKETTADCLAYISREDVRIDQEGIVSLVIDAQDEPPTGEELDFTNPTAADAPQGLQSEGASSLDNPPPPVYQCDKCLQTYPVKTANNKCLTKGCKGTVKPRA